MSGVTLYDRWNSGTPIDQFTPQERGQLRELLRREPAYSDPKGHNHAAYVQDVAALYAADFPEAAE